MAATKLTILHNGVVIYENINNDNINVINNEILTLSFSIYNNYNNLLATRYNIFNTLINNDTNIYNYGYTISGNLNKLQNNIINNYATNLTTANLQNQINNCIESGDNIMTDNILISNPNIPYEVTISAPINIQYGSTIIPGFQTNNAQGGKGPVIRSNYIRFNYGRFGVLVIKTMQM